MKPKKAYIALKLRKTVTATDNETPEEQKLKIVNLDRTWNIVNG